MEGYYEEFMQQTFRRWDNSGAKIESTLTASKSPPSYHLPNKQNPTWHTVIGYSFDSNSHIGLIPGKSGNFIIAGFNDHRMPDIWLAAKGLAEMVRTGNSFGDVRVPMRLPRLFKTTQARIDRAQKGPESGDILNWWVWTLNIDLDFEMLDWKVIYIDS